MKQPHHVCIWKSRASSRITGTRIGLTSSTVFGKPLPPQQVKSIHRLFGLILADRKSTQILREHSWLWDIFRFGHPAALVPYCSSTVGPPPADKWLRGGSRRPAPNAVFG